MYTITNKEAMTLAAEVSIAHTSHGNAIAIRYDAFAGGHSSVVL